VNLFGGGGKSAPPPLVQFQLPDSQSQTIYISSNTRSNTEPAQYQSAQIADAVKKALLNSSSLNDVIAEI
jgi:hypothetical protein